MRTWYRNSDRGNIHTHGSETATGEIYTHMVHRQRQGRYTLTPGTTMIPTVRHLHQEPHSETLTTLPAVGWTLPHHYKQSILAWQSASPPRSHPPSPAVLQTAHAVPTTHTRKPLYQSHHQLKQWVTLHGFILAGNLGHLTWVWLQHHYPFLQCVQETACVYHFMGPNNVQ